MPGLTKQQDAFGQEIWDYHRGQPVREIVERDDGGIALSGGPANYFTEHAGWPQYERDAIALARGRVLDAGCGAGRVALHMQSRGLEVVAMDNSPLALKVCKARGIKRVKLLPFGQISRRLGLFDSVVMCNNNFGLFGNFTRAQRLLRRLHGMTSPDGRIIASTMDPYQTTEPMHLSYHRRNRARGRMGGQVRIRVRYKNYATPWFDYLLVSKQELAAILDGTGWQATRFFDDDGGRYMVVMEKEVCGG